MVDKEDEKKLYDRRPRLAKFKRKEPKSEEKITPKKNYKGYDFKEHKMSPDMVLTMARKKEGASTWESEHARKILIYRLVEIAQDEENKEFSLGQIYLRAGIDAHEARRLSEKYDDLKETFKFIKNILQRRWLYVGLSGKGHSNVVVRFLTLYSKAEAAEMDEREIKKALAIEKGKSDIREAERQSIVDEIKTLTPEQALSIHTLYGKASEIAEKTKEDIEKAKADETVVELVEIVKKNIDNEDKKRDRL